MSVTREDEWLFGWDETPGIVSVWAETDGRATVYRRLPGTRALVCEHERFRPFLLLDSLTYLEHLGKGLVAEAGGVSPRAVTYEVLEGHGGLRFLVRAHDARVLAQHVLEGASRLSGKRLTHLTELGDARVLSLSPDDQYLTATGRTYFRDLAFGDLARMQFDLETTGLDPVVDRIFLVAVRGPDGATETLEARGEDDAAEAALISELIAYVQRTDPDVIENHNLHGFDLPFLVRRAKAVGVPLALGRIRPGIPRKRPSARGSSFADDVGSMRRSRYTLPGRELIDTLDAVRRYDFAARDLPGHGLKAVAKHFGIAHEDREMIPGARVYETFRTDPDRVRRYACEDVHEAAGLAEMLGGASFALARLAPRRYERLADAGPATGILDPMLVRAYLRARTALPAHEAGDGTPHTGAALHLFASGVAKKIVKADVASLYPSLMREYRIHPKRDRLGVLLSLVDRLTDLRLSAKGRARTLPAGSPERHTDEALSAAMKIVINSAYGYLGAVGLTRFADVHAANEVTRRGRETLAFLCRELAARGVTLLEADTDGVYFTTPEHFDAENDRSIVAEVAALLPSHVHLELDGRYAAMLSHEPKNYALLGYDDGLLLKGVAFRSSRAEPYGEAFLRRAIRCLFEGDVAGARAAFVETALALRARRIPTYDVTARVRLTKTREQYEATPRKELSYEAMIASGRASWRAGERVRVYRAANGRPALFEEHDDGVPRHDPRDYDAAYYERLLRETFAARLVRALAPGDFAAVVADPAQLGLFDHSLARARPVLTVHLDARTLTAESIR